MLLRYAHVWDTIGSAKIVVVVVSNGDCYSE